MKPKILLVEDDETLGNLLSNYLRSEEMEVCHLTNGQQALLEAEKSRYDLFLFDIMLPGKTGFELAKGVRKLFPAIPLIFISARSLKSDKLMGYETGADDYITKPFDEEELLWKIKALIRRNAPEDPVDEFFQFGSLQFTPQLQLLRTSSGERRLTQKESQLLAVFFKNIDRVIKREDLLFEVWGQNDYFLGRSLDVFIAKLRKYLKDEPQLSIETIFGAGFVLKSKSIES